MRRIGQARWGMAIVAGSVLLVAGCTAPPEQEKNAAQAAMNAAAAAKAEVYAPDTMADATGLWGQAEAAMQQKHYAPAKQVYVEAKTAFDRAVEDAGQAKQALVEENQTRIGTLETAWKALGVQAAKKMKKAAAAEKKAWSTDAESVQAALTTARDANQEPMDSKTKLDEVQAILDKWQASLKK